MQTLGWLRSRRTRPARRTRFCGVAAQQPVFVHHDHAEAVAGFQEFGRGRIMRGAIGIAAHVLEPLHAEILQAVRQGRADARVVLVIAGALEDVRLPVQEKSLVGIEGHSANAERGLGGVEHSAARFDGCDAAGTSWAFRATTGWVPRPWRSAAFLWLSGRRGGPTFSSVATVLSVGRDDLALHDDLGRCALCVQQAGLNMNRGRALRHVIPELAEDEGAVRRHGDGSGLHQPHMPVDAGPLVEPALGLRGIHLDRERVLPAAISHIRNVIPETAVAAFLPAQAPPV